MIERAQHDDVVAYRLSWWRSRMIGFGVHAFQVRGVLIDTGFPAVMDDVLAIARDQRLRGAIVTHQHEDHAGNADALARAGVPLAIGDETRTIISGAYPMGLYRHYTWRAMPRFSAPFEPFSDHSLSMLHTPGHCTDHHAVWDNETHTLFAGDLFLGVKVRISHTDENPYESIRSLRAMIERRPARVFCAHRGLVPNGAQALAAKADWLESTTTRIVALHREGVDQREIRRRVLGKLDNVHWFSAGAYSPVNIVSAAIAHAPDR